MPSDRITLTLLADAVIEAKVTDLPPGAAVDNAVLVIKNSLADHDGDALILKSISGAETVSGIITNDSDNASATLSFSLLESEIVSPAFAPGSQYEYAIKVWLSNGQQIAPATARGSIYIVDAGVEATSP